MSNNPDKALSKRKHIQKPYMRSVTVNQQTIQFIFKDATFAEIFGEEMLLDKVAIDYLIDNLSSGLSKDPSFANTLPKTIILSKESLDTSQINSSKTTSSLHPSSAAPSHINESSNNDQPRVQDSSAFTHHNISDQNASSTPKKPTATVTDNDINKLVKDTQNDYFKVFNPRYTFEDVYVEPSFKRRIVSSLILAKQKKKLYEDWGLLQTLKNRRPLVLNFYGPPGTGKSMMAEAIAQHLDKVVFLVNYSELESGNPGETPKKIVQCFRQAQDANAVLIFDEADSFLGKRLTNVTSASDYNINVTRSVMLMELEKFDGIIVFTTNFSSNYDIAFKRRIFASLEFKLPDEQGRAHIWSTHLPRELPLSPGITPLALAYKYGGTTGADIKDIVLFAAVNCLEKGRERLSWEDFDEAHIAIKNRYNVV